MGVRFGGSRSIYTPDSELGLARLNFRPCAHFVGLIGLFILLLHLDLVCLLGVLLEVISKLLV